MVDELLLQGMQRVALGHALDGLDRPAFGFRTQHEAGADEPPVEHDAAGPAIARAAALLAAGQAKAVTQHIQQRLVAFADIFDRVAIDLRGNVNLVHHLPLARFSAISAARRASTPATSIRNSIVPRLSSMGRQALEQAAARFASALASTLVPMR